MTHRERSTESPVSYSVDALQGAFEVHGYNRARPFSSFLPGIAGPWGVPAWTFWVNRGQAIAGLGAKDRDGQILEFMSFNKACGRVPTEGFRTFLRLDDAIAYEPFRWTDDPDIDQVLRVDPAELTLREVNPRLGIEVSVVYHDLPGHRTAGLVRTVTVTDLSGRPRRLEWVDGAPRVLPYGIGQHEATVTARHIEAMIGVDRIGDAALFRLRQSATDSADIQDVSGSNFWWTVPSSSAVAHPVVDPRALFGDQFSFDRPRVLNHDGLTGVLGFSQAWRGLTPSAFTAVTETLPPHGRCKLTSVLGMAEVDADLEALMALGGSGLAALGLKNRANIDAITDIGHTVSASEAFDAYCRQNFLDNVIRGGLPISLGSDGAVVYAFSHQNGDLERDYHQFVVTAEYLSQGLGHYRNTAQNRRNDPWFFTDLGDINLKLFFGLIQLDGYNPLEVRPQRFRVDDAAAVEDWARTWVPDTGERLRLLENLGRPFSIGRLAMWLEEANGALPPGDALTSAMEFLSAEEPGGIEAGFWIDHWRYAVDLLESTLAVYPDHISRLLLDGGYTWFDNPDTVLPRRERALDQGSGFVKTDQEKAARIAGRRLDAHRARTSASTDEIAHSTLLEKLLLLAATRLATLDPSGRGIEMEAGKPGWNDSLNGLPGLLGSGLSETLALRRLLRRLASWLAELDRDEVEIFVELADLIARLHRLVDLRADSLITAAAYWDRANDLKEAYRETIRPGIDGSQCRVTVDELERFCASGLRMLDATFLGGGRDTVMSPADIPHTYFVHRPRGGGAFDASAVGPFLEGPTNWLREFPEDATKIYRAIRTSTMFDPVLGMYKSSGPMGDADPRLGRAVGAYPPGWLENESVYTHMEFKYLLEVLRSGLAEEFWADARKALPPFMDPAIYGRSPFEGCSFIVSSAHADPTEHGRGYQPRLSGMTAEFIDIWLLAAFGPNPFRVESGRLQFAPDPSLPSWLFTTVETNSARRASSATDETTLPPNTYAISCFGGTLISFHNPARRDTFGAHAVRPQGYRLVRHDMSDGRVTGPILPDHEARELRAGMLQALEIHLG